MINDAVTVVKAINDRSIGDRAAEPLDPPFVRHDLAQLYRDSHGPGGASDFLSVIISVMPGFRLGTGDRTVVLLRMPGTHTGRRCSTARPRPRCRSARCSSTGLPAAASPKPGSW